jgi:uncharacterized protein with HEPN domain
MQPKTPKWLEDVAEHAGYILAETAGRTLADYEANLLLRSAVERWFEIIGEALLRIERTDPATATRIADLRQVVGFRNRLAHGYDTTNHALVWQIIQGSLPRLKANVDSLLTEAERDHANGEPTSARAPTSALRSRYTPPRSQPSGTLWVFNAGTWVARGLKPRILGSRVPSGQL